MGSVGKVLVTQVQGCGSIHRTTQENLGVMACTRNPSPREADTEDLWGSLASQPLPTWSVSGQ